MEESEDPVRLEDFELLALAGDGAAGKVWRARLKRRLAFADAGVVVAVKIFNQEILVQPGQRERIRREFNTGWRLAHINLVRIYFADVDAAEPFLVMEWCDGGNLETWLKAHPAPPDGGTRVFALFAPASP